jgi:uncharacterized protein (DUF305 family)
VTAVYPVITVSRLFLSALLTLPSVLAQPASAQQPPAPIVQPGAPGEASRRITANQASDLSTVTHSETDVRFMRGMMMHHAQALEMTALRPTRSSADDLRLLALRIEISQADEIELMKDWLTARGLAVDDAHAHHGGATAASDQTASNQTASAQTASAQTASAQTASDHMRLMPGMLTPAEMARLARANGVEFERLFLELMIKHHDGALVMVRDLFASADAAQESDVFAFASEVEADQAAEIGRMAAMLRERQR